MAKLSLNSIGKDNEKIKANLHRIQSDFKDIKNEYTFEKIQARFIIIDGKELTFMILNDDDVHPSYDVGIWVNTPFFAGALEQFFEIAWKDLKPFAKLKV